MEARDWSLASASWNNVLGGLDSGSDSDADANDNDDGASDAGEDKDDNDNKSWVSSRVI